jgi:hypothetical protein
VVDIIDLITSAVVTFVSVLFGFGLSLWWDRRKDSIAIKETRRRVLNALVADLSAMQVLLAEPNEDGEGVRVYRLPRVAVESALGSGSLSLLSSEVQQIVSEIDRLVKDCEMLTDYLFTAVGAEGGMGREWIRTRVRLFRSRGILQTKLPEAIEALTVEIKGIG